MRYDESALHARVDQWKAKKESPYEAPRASSTPSGAAFGFAVVGLASFIMGIAVGWLWIARLFPLTPHS